MDHLRWNGHRSIDDFEEMKPSLSFLKHDQSISINININININQYQYKYQYQYQNQNQYQNQYQSPMFNHFHPFLQSLADRIHHLTATLSEFCHRQISGSGPPWLWQTQLIYLDIIYIYINISLYIYMTIYNYIWLYMTIYDYMYMLHMSKKKCVHIIYICIYNG